MLWKSFGVIEVLVQSLVEDFPSASLLCTNTRPQKKQTICNYIYLLILKCLFRQLTRLKYRKCVWARNGLSIFPSLSERGGRGRSGNRCFLAFAQPSCFGIIRSWKCTVTKSLLYQIQTFLSTPGFNFHFQCQRSAD